MRDNSDLAILLIDMQQNFLNSVYLGIDKLIKTQIKVLKKVSEADIPLVVLEYATSFGKEHQKTIPKLQKVGDKFNRKRTIMKRYGSGFNSTGLEIQLKEWKIKEVFLMGVYGSVCVYSTALGAVENGFLISTSSDVISNESDCGEAYARIGTFYQNADEFLDEID